MTDEDVNPTTEELLNAECEKLAKERDQAIGERDELARALLDLHAVSVGLPWPPKIYKKVLKAIAYLDPIKPNGEVS